ncbi:MAG: proton-conducting transporter membrane subunit, partial [Thiotrichaceae bacterium]
MIENFAWIVPITPLLAALYIGISSLLGFNRGESGEPQTANAALGAVAFSLFLMLIFDAVALLSGVSGHIHIAEWFHSGDIKIDYSLHLDALALSIGTLVCFLLLIAIRFSVNYLHREEGFQRFFMVISLFASGMLFIVLAGNGVITFVGWELAGLSSYLLIGYATDRPIATANANYAFITNRIGDAGLIFALYLTFTYIGSADWVDIMNHSAEQSTLHLGMMLSGFLIAALAKSAMLPFSSWISKALEGPTPSSAIFYGSLMVHAGVYLVIRLQFLFEQVPMLMWMLVVIGALSALYGWLSALVQTDVKSSLMFSTTAQVGLMFVECGLGWFELAAWHLALHAIWRAWQFLSSPALMHMVSRPARPVSPWLQKSGFLYTAALQRFWLDHFADWFILRPIKSLSDEVRDFDEKVVHRIIGLPTEQGGLQGLRQQKWIDNVGKGRGVSGRLMELVASAFEWFEERLILQGGGEGLFKV